MKALSESNNLYLSAFCTIQQYKPLSDIHQLSGGLSFYGRDGSSAAEYSHGELHGSKVSKKSEAEVKA